MKKKVYESVCTCTREGRIVFMDTRLLQEVVNEGLEEVSEANLPWSDVETALNGNEEIDDDYVVDCAAYCSRVVAMWGLMLGQLCESVGHFGMALDVWRSMLTRVNGYDFDGWLYANRHSDIRFWGFVNVFGAVQIGRRIDQLLIRQKFHELAHYEHDANFYYEDLWEDTYFESMCDFTFSRDEDWNKFTTCSWEDDILSRRYSA